MPRSTIFTLTGEPGVQRDGTIFDTKAYTDAQWCRFNKERPKKMGGYRMMTDAYAGLNRGCNIFSKDGLFYVAAGSANKLEQATFDTNGFGSGVVDRSPSGFSTNANNLWQIDYIYDTTSAAALVIAHAAPNLADIDNSVTGLVYYGDANDTAALTAISSSGVSGGICVSGVYLFRYGTDGFLGWSVPNQPLDIVGAGSGDNQISDGKITRGYPVLATQGNSTLFWSTTGLIRAEFVGGTGVFSFPQVSAKGYSVLSSMAIVEVDGIFYWPGVDRFLVYNGVTSEVPNRRNRNFFFDSLNFQQRQKVWGLHNSRWNEVWWFFPRNNSVECNHAIIYNYATKEWYDTPIARVSGVSSQIFRYPIMFDDTSTSGLTRLWMHEFGVDEIVGSNSTAIPSSFTSPVYTATGTGLTSGSEGKDMLISIDRIDPDYVGTGNLQFETLKRDYPRGTDSTLGAYNTDDLTPEDYFFKAQDQGRLMRVKVTSNEAGGDYHMGATQMLISEGRKLS